MSRVTLSTAPEPLFLIYKVAETQTCRQLPGIGYPALAEPSPDVKFGDKTDLTFTTDFGFAFGHSAGCCGLSKLPGNQMSTPLTPTSGSLNGGTAQMLLQKTLFSRLGHMPEHHKEWNLLHKIALVINGICEGVTHALGTSLALTYLVEVSPITPHIPIWCYSPATWGRPSPSYGLDRSQPELFGPSHPPPPFHPESIKIAQELTFLLRSIQRAQITLLPL